MRKLVMILVPVLLAAGCQSAGSEYREADNGDLATLGDCREIRQKAVLTKNHLSRLKSLKKRSEGANALTDGAALLALNPFMLLDIDRPGHLNAVIKSYEDRLAALETQEDEQCTGEEGDNAVVSAVPDTLPFSGSPAPAEKVQTVRKCG